MDTEILKRTDIMADTSPEHESLEAQPGLASDDATETASQAGGEYDKLAAELQDAKDRHLRLLAEWDNYRRRTVKENFDLVASANAKLLGKLTEVLDDFNLAFDPKHKSDKPEKLEEGMRLIYNKFKNLLSEEGLVEIDPQGAEFDPNLHDALMQQPSDKVPENHVMQVLMKGYKVKDKILKHAKVIVSTGKSA